MDRSNDPRHDFYANPTVDELIAQQRKEPIRDPRVLLGDFWPEDEPIEEFHRRQLGHLGKRRLRLLLGLLNTARGTSA